MRSSLPELFRKNSLSISRPEKQGGIYSLFLKSNNFNQQNNQEDQSLEKTAKSRYSNNRFSLQQSQTHRAHRSMDNMSKKKLNATMNLLSGTEHPAKLIKQKHSRSFFIQQTTTLNGELEANNFKSIRKNVLEQLNLIQKAISLVSKQQQSLRMSFQNLKQSAISDLQQFEQSFYMTLRRFQKEFKILRRQVGMQIKVNKEQIKYLEEETTDLKAIYANFEIKEDEIRFHLIEGDNQLNNKP